MNICVYGAASETIDRRYIEAAEELGAAIAKRGHTLVFGGGAWGLMGGAARGAHRENGAIVGIARAFSIPTIFYTGTVPKWYLPTLCGSENSSWKTAPRRLS